MDKDRIKNAYMDVMAAIGEDIETGTHDGNNSAMLEFVSKFPRLMRALTVLGTEIFKEDADREDNL